MNDGVHKTHDSEAQSQKPRRCPECDYLFKGNGWDGIDAHWRANHNHIKPYEDAWPEIKAGIYIPNPKE